MPKALLLLCCPFLFTEKRARAAPAAAAAAAAGRSKSRRCRLEDLRSLVPAVVPPDAGVSYNPSAETQEQQMISAAAAAVLQQQPEGRSTKAVLQGCMQDKEERLQQQQQLLLEMHDPLKALKHKQPVTAALLQHMEAEKVHVLSDKEKQRVRGGYQSRHFNVLLQY